MLLGPLDIPKQKLFLKYQSIILYNTQLKIDEGRNIDQFM